MIFLEPKRIYNGPFDGHHDRPDRAVVGAPARRGARGPLHGAARIGGGRAARRRASPCSPTARWCTCREAAARETGIDAEIIDLRSLWPLDLDTIVASVKKTGRCVIVHEATRTSGFGAELAALVQEHCFYPPRGADRARDRLGHAVSARAGVGVLPRPRARRRGAAARDGGLRWAIHVVKVPDIGEGIAEVELVAWHVAAGRHRRRGPGARRRDDRQGDRRDPVAGRGHACSRARGSAGDKLAVGQRADPDRAVGEAATDVRRTLTAAARRVHGRNHGIAHARRPRRAPVAPAPTGKPLASPAVRRHARELGVDLAQVPGSGPDGRVVHEDVVRLRAARRATAAPPPRARSATPSATASSRCR